METDDNRGNKVIATISKLVSNDTKSFKLRLYYISKIEYMTILTRQERERLVIDLYNQGKTYRKISKEARISPRDIGIILNNVVGEKKTEGLKEEQGNDDSDKNQEHQSISTQAHKLFSDGKTPLEVAIKLNLKSQRQLNSVESIGS